MGPGAVGSLLAIGAMVLLGVGSSTPRDVVGPLVADPTDGAGILGQNVQHSRTWSIVGVLACPRTTPASFVVRSVTMLDITPDASVVTGVSTATSPFVGLGLQPGSLPPSYAAAGPLDARTFESPSCPGGVGGLDVGASVTSDQPWSAGGLEVVYVANGTEHTVRWRFDIGVCAPTGRGPCPTRGDAFEGSDPGLTSATAG